MYVRQVVLWQRALRAIAGGASSQFPSQRTAALCSEYVRKISAAPTAFGSVVSGCVLIWDQTELDMIPRAYKRAS